MRATDFIIEKRQKKDEVTTPVQIPVDESELLQMKSILSKKIKELPYSKETHSALAEIEDILGSVNAGGRKGFIGNQLKIINDPTVNAAHKLLSKYILSIDASPKDKEEMFSLWRNDELVDVKTLLTPGRHSINDIITNYKSNPAVKELTDDLLQIAALGQGKGEFILSVFSKNITKRQKGDLEISGKNIELKTTDVKPARLYDQEVRPASGYAAAVDTFKKTWASYIKSSIGSIKKSGINLSELMSLSQVIHSTDREKFYDTLENVISNIFPNVDISELMSAIRSNNLGAAKQLYCLANLEFYQSIKTDDDGMLFIDLKTSPNTFTFFTNADELNQSGLRLHSNTIYPITSDPRNAYPQISISKSKQASSSLSIPATPTPVEPVPQQPVAQQAQPASAQPTQAQPNTIDPELQNFVNDLVAQGITDPVEIRKQIETKFQKPKNNEPDELDNIKKNAGIPA